jgi:hypothetical protein
MLKKLSFSPEGDVTNRKNTPGTTTLADTGVAAGSQQTHGDAEKHVQPQPPLFDHKSGSEPNEPLHWGDGVVALAKLKENLIHWEPDFDVEAFEKEGTLHKQAAERTSKEKSDVRLYHTHRMTDKAIESLESVPELYSPYACYLDGHPVGVMLLENGPPVEIGYMITHPGSSGVGATLVERAVNLSEAWGESGCVELTDNNAEARKAYIAMGFVDEGGQMKLDPSTSDRWVQQQGQWRLK